MGDSAMSPSRAALSLHAKTWTFGLGHEALLHTQLEGLDGGIAEVCIHAERPLTIGCKIVSNSISKLSEPLSSTCRLFPSSSPHSAITFSNHRRLRSTKDGCVGFHLHAEIQEVYHGVTEAGPRQVTCSMLLPLTHFHM